MTLVAAAEAIAARRLDPRELVETVLARIDRIDPRLCAFIALDRAGALRAAEQAAQAVRAGNRLGALHGVPIAMKDVFDVAGLRTTANSRLFVDAPPAQDDCALVSRLRRAGAIILGKLHCWELSVGGPSDEPPFPPARNPWDPSRDPGGSSSGPGVAVAAGLVPVAIGGDTGGSIRLPAAACGVVGFKPSFGIVPMTGAIPFASSLDVAGPLAQNVADAAAVHAVLADAHIDMRGATLRGLRIGVPRALLELAPPTTAMAMRLAEILDHLRTAGAIVRDVTLASAARFNAGYFLVARSEAFAHWRAALASDAGKIGAIARRSLAMGALLDERDVLLARRLRIDLTRELAAAFDDIDMLCLPTMPGEAGPLAPDDAVTRPDTAPYTRPFSLVGAPAISLPCGLGSNGLPLGVQFVARYGDDSRLLTLAHAVETSAGWPWRNLEPDLGPCMER